MRYLSLFFCSLFLYSLGFSIFISEVYFDGTDEFIEVYNNSDSEFSGDLIFSGVKSSNLKFENIIILPNSFFIVADTFDGFEFIEGNVFESGKGLSISDTKEINIELIVSDIVVDTFYVEKELVSESDNNKSSFIRYGDDDLCEIYINQNEYSDGIFANPFEINLLNSNSSNSMSGSGGYSSDSGFSSGTYLVDAIVDGDIHFIEEFFDFEEEDDLEVNSDIQCVLDSESSPEWQNSLIDFYSGSVSITQINPYDGEFPEYIELTFHGIYSGNLEIEGLGGGSSSKDFDILAYSGNKYIITDSYSGFVITGNIIKLSSISLTNGGENLTLYGQGGQQLETVQYEGFSKGTCNYFNGNYLSGNKLLDKPEICLPGIDLSYKKYFENNDDNSNLTCSIYLQNSSAFGDTNSPNFQAKINNKLIQNSDKNYYCSRNFGNNEYSSDCNPSYIKYTNSGIKNIVLDVTDSLGNKICSDEYLLNLPELQVKSSISTTTSCSYYKGLYEKWKEKSMSLKEQIEKIGFNVTRSRIVEGNEKEDNSMCTVLNTDDEKYQIYSGINLIGGNIQRQIGFNYIIPNPKGRDSLGETIDLYKSASGLQIDTADYFIEIKGKQYSLTGFTDYGTGLLLTGDLGLVNKGGCVYLKYLESTIDKLCYSNAKDDVKISLAQVTNDLIDLSSFKISLEDEQVCGFYLGQKISCKNLKITKSDLDELKSEKKEISKTNTKLKNENKSLTSKLSTASKKIDSWKNKYNKYEQYYKEQKEKLKISKNKIDDEFTEYKFNSKEKLLEQKSKTKLEKKLVKLYKNILKTLLDDLKKNRDFVYKDNKVLRFMNDLNDLEVLLENGVDSYDIFGFTVDSSDIKNSIRLKSGNFNLGEYSQLAYSGLVLQLNDIKNIFGKLNLRNNLFSRN